MPIPTPDRHSNKIGLEPIVAYNVLGYRHRSLSAPITTLEGHDDRIGLDLLGHEDERLRMEGERANAKGHYSPHFNAGPDDGGKRLAAANGGI